jgi:hypothetical protein
MASLQGRGLKKDGEVLATACGANAVEYRHELGLDHRYKEQQPACSRGALGWVGRNRLHDVCGLCREGEGTLIGREIDRLVV